MQVKNFFKGTFLVLGCIFSIITVLFWIVGIFYDNFYSLLFPVFDFLKSIGISYLFFLCGEIGALGLTLLCFFLHEKIR